MKKRVEIFFRYLLVLLSYIFLVLFAVIFNSTSGWFMFYFVTTVFFFSLLAIFPRFKKLQLKNENATFYNRGIYNNLEMTLLKPWSLPRLGVRVEVIPNSYKDYFGHNPVRFISTDKIETRNFDWIPIKRGSYNDLSFTVITSDFFQIFSHKTTLKLDATLYVLPKEDTGYAEKLFSIITEINRLKTNQRAPEVKKYRTYQDGDSWRFIDWNLTARNRELIVKEFEIERDTMFHLIFLGEAGPNFEEMLSCYYSFQKKLRLQIDIEQTLIGQEGCFSYQNSEEIFAWLNPFQKFPQSLKGMESIKEKIVLVFLTTEQEQIPGPIKKLEKRNVVYYIHLSKGDFIFRKSGK